MLRFERFEVGAGIEKKQEDFVAEVMAQVKRGERALSRRASRSDSDRNDPARRGVFFMAD